MAQISASLRDVIVEKRDLLRLKVSFPQSRKDYMQTTAACGGVAGCCAKSAVAPFDRVKILLQAHHKHFNKLGVVSTFGRVVDKEGLVGLYKGNGTQMVRIFPYAAIQFMSYEQYKNYIWGTYGQNQVTKMVTGSLAGMTAVLLTYPLDVVRARLAFQFAGEDMYLGIFHTVKVMFTKEGGVRGLYRGIVPTLIGMMPYAGLSFYSFETLKSFCLEHFPHYLGTQCTSANGTQSLVLIIPAKLMCGGLAGAFAQAISYPLDVTRRKMQLAMMLPDSQKYSTWYGTLAYIVRTHGVKHGLYRGLGINCVKVTLMMAVSFCTYELMKQMLGLDASIAHR